MTHPTPQGRVLRRLAIKLGALVLGGSVTLAAALALTQALLPPLDMSRYQRLSPVITARDGEWLNVFLTEDDRWRIHTPADSVSPRYVQALLAIEDQHFYRHPGVNPFAMVRAAGQWLRHGRVVSGGSTLTMQVVRLLEPRPRTMRSKWIEITRALQLEQQWSKHDILTMYLTLLPMGGNLESVQAASHRYLHTDPRQLSLAEVSVLLAIPQSPERRRPDRHGERTLEAAERIADRLIALGLFAPQDKDELNDLMLDQPQAFPNHSWHLSRQLADAHPGSARMPLTSTLDYRLQRVIEEQAEATRFALIPEQNMAVLVMDARTGEVLAHLGSLGLASASGYLDLTRAVRSPGSALKPFIYGMAMDDGLITDQTILWDQPTRFGAYVPSNFELGHQGAVRAGVALQDSLNIPAVQVMEQLGPQLFLQAWQQAGLAYVLPSDADANVAVALGAIGVRLSDLVQAYAALASEQSGRIPTLRTVAGEPTAHQPSLLSPESARQLHAILAAAPMVDGRLHRSLSRNGAAAAFKTGTSYGYRDAWAVGAMGPYVVGVWIGRPDGAPVTGNTGRTSALRLAMEVADQLPANDPPPPWLPLPIDDSVVARTASIIHPQPNTDLVLTQAPHPERRIALALSAAHEHITVQVNGQALNDPQHIPVPHNGAYRIELFDKHVLRQTVEFTVISPILSID